MSFLRLFLSLEAHLVHVVLQALRLKLELVVLSLKDALGRPLLLYLLRMLDQQVVLLHLGQVALFPHLDQLGVQVGNAPLSLVDISAQLANLLLVPALLQLQVQRVVLLRELLHLGLVPAAKVANEFLILIPRSLQCRLNYLKLAATFIQSITSALKLLPPALQFKAELSLKILLYAHAQDV